MQYKLVRKAVVSASQTLYHYSDFDHVTWRDCVRSVACGAGAWARHQTVLHDDQYFYCVSQIRWTQGNTMSYKKSNKLRHMHTAVLLRKTHNDIQKVL